MDATQIIIDLAVLSAVAGILILIGYAITRIIATIKPTNPAQADILHALREFAKEAYAAGISMALSANQQEQAALTSADIKAIADRYYALLPDTITIGGKTFPIGWVKLFVTQAEWESLVKSVADEIEARLARNAAWLTTQLNAVKAVQNAAQVPPRFSMPPIVPITVANPTIDRG